MVQQQGQPPIGSQNNLGSKTPTDDQIQIDKIKSYQQHGEREKVRKREAVRCVTAPKNQQIHNISGEGGMVSYK